MLTRNWLVSLGLVAALAAPAAAQSLTGSVEGVVTDEQGGALAGATVVLSGKTGSRTAVTDDSGTYRFVALDPGVYSVQAHKVGFKQKKLENLAIAVGKQARVDLSLAVGGMEEAVDVVAEAPVVDVSSSATDNALSQEMLFNLPIRPTNAATQLLDILPGVNDGSAYGSDADTANALLLDGVDTRDPEGGSAWTFFDYNLVEEVQLQGLGAPAEYGAFMGAVVNTITKSGGNSFGGLFDVFYTRESLGGDNVEAGQITQNPALSEPSVIQKKLETTAQVSGPLVKDKLFFFASGSRLKLTQDPSGPRTIRDEVSPRFNVKLTYQPTANDNLTGMFQADQYNVIGRNGVPALLTTDELTNREDAPELVWNFQWRHLFGSSSFAEVKYTGWTGYFDLNPEVEAPGHFDAGSGLYSNSQGWFYYADRGRHQVNASITHHAQAFGQHELKFGVEVERSRVRSRYGYTNDLFYYDYAAYYPVGQYTAYDYGYDVSGRNRRESVYLQDRWRVNDRLTVNPGVRLDSVRGFSPDLDRPVYDVKNVAPRFGFAFDLTGDNKTVLKGSYGQYYEGAFFLAYSSATPGIEDFVLNAYDPAGPKCGPLGNCFSEYDRSPAALYQVDPDMKHPRSDEFTIGLERALTRDLRFAVTGIFREDKNLQASVSPSARWNPIQLENPLTGQGITAYQWANRAASETDLLLTNPDGFQYRDQAGNVIGTARSFRKYRGLMLVLDKRFSDRWQARVSYVLSKAEGTVDNSGFDSYGSSTLFESASRALTNLDGLLSNDRRHELKVLATYQVPVVDVGLSAYFRGLSGSTYQPFYRFSSQEINFPTASGRELLLEPRGSHRLPARKQLDLRLEKIFRVGRGEDRVSVYADVNNALNESTAIDVITRYPDQAIAGIDDPVVFGSPATLIAPRQLTLGARWSF